MTKEEFLEQVNKYIYPKYLFSQIKEGVPEKDCSAIICLKSGSILLAQYKYGIWQQAHFSTTENGGRQEIYYTDINEGIVYWTDGKPKDYSREQYN